MKAIRVISAACAAAFVWRVLAAAQAPPAPAPPAWAYGVPSPAAAGGAGARTGGAGAAPLDDGSPKHLAGSTQAFTLAQLRDAFNVADWYPDDHPPAPPIVLTGRRPDVRACGLCHYPNGRGRPENSSIAGLPVVYFEHTLADFKNGFRHSAEPRKTNTAIMSAIAKGMTDDDVRSAAEYFASMKTGDGWIRVVEAAAVPRTRLASGMFTPLEGGETEPLGARIIEVPEHPQQTELRDSRADFVAYVPVGSVKRGEALVVSGGGRTTACGVCHGADLHGLGPVPGIAGRSPSYEVRQLYDMQAGTRTGVWTELMKSVVARLSTDDMLAIAAYLASRPVDTSR
jgi:cytochrome c553